MFEAFSSHDIALPGAIIHARVGGRGPPMLLLHGHPQTHTMWHRVAGELARDFTVVAADLRGYGDSSRPQPGEDNAAYSKSRSRHMTAARGWRIAWRWIIRNACGA
jgi:haloacetate dehalogenase